MDYQSLMDHQAFMDNQEYMSHKRNLIIWIIKVSIIPSLYPPPMTVSPPLHPFLFFPVFPCLLLSKSQDKPLHWVKIYTYT